MCTFVIIFFSSYIADFSVFLTSVFFRFYSFMRKVKNLCGVIYTQGTFPLHIIWSAQYKLYHRVIFIILKVYGHMNTSQPRKPELSYGRPTSAVISVLISCLKGLRIVLDIIIKDCVIQLLECVGLLLSSTQWLNLNAEPHVRVDLNWCILYIPYEWIHVWM